MNRKARITHSQETTSRAMALPKVGFDSASVCSESSCSAGVWTSSSPFIWHRVNFNDQWLFVPCRARIEFGLRAVNRINARVAGSAVRAAGILHGAAQIFE